MKVPRSVMGARQSTVALFFAVSLYLNLVNAQNFTESNPCGECFTEKDRYLSGGWTKATPTATFESAATVFVLTNDRTNTTRKSTVWNLPSGVTLPPTNSGGTVIQTVVLTWNSKPLTTVLTWPTEYTQYVESVTWSGVIPVETALPSLGTSSIPRYANGSVAAPSCSTALEPVASRFPTPMWPSFNPPESGANKTRAAFNADEFYSWNFVEAEHTAGCGGYDPTDHYRSAYPDFAPYRYCGINHYACPVGAVQGAALLTVTSTVHEDTFTSTSPPSEPKSTAISPTATQTSAQAATTAGPANTPGAISADESASTGGQPDQTANEPPATTKETDPASSVGVNDAPESPASTSADGDSDSAESSGDAENVQDTAGDEGQTTAVGATDAPAASPDVDSGTKDVEDLQITTDSQGRTVAVDAPPEPTTITLSSGAGNTEPTDGGASEGGAGEQRDESSDDNQAPAAIPGAEFTYTSSGLSTVVTPIIDSGGRTVIILTPSSAGENGIAIGANQGSSPSTVLLYDSAAGEPTVGQPYTYVSGSISKIVTPTTDETGHTIAILTPIGEKLTTNAAGVVSTVGIGPAATITLSDNAPGNPVVGQEYTYTSGTISAIVTPTTNAAGQTVAVLPSTGSAAEILTDGSGGSVLVTDLPYTTIPLSAVPSSLFTPGASGVAGVPFTYVSGSVSEVVTPTVVSGRTVVVLSSSTTVPIVSGTNTGASSSQITVAAVTTNASRSLSVKVLCVYVASFLSSLFIL